MASTHKRVLGQTPGMVDQPRDPVSLDFQHEIQASELICPICSECLQSLSLMNRHLDDEHSEISQDVSEIGIRSWLQKQIGKSSRLGPVAAIGKSLKFSEEFERNGVSSLTGLEATQQTDSKIVSDHWQSEVSSSHCSERQCNRRQRGAFRQSLINCRHCGKLYCSVHTLYQMRLSRSAAYEPMRGTWCRVCLHCYREREWYNNTAGQARDLTTPYNESRRKAYEAQDLDRQRLEKRLTRLLQGISDVPDPVTIDKLDFFGTFSKRSAQIRQFEQQIVPWEDESGVKACPTCARTFFLNQGKHHCRLCGRCYCGDFRSQCSLLVPFNVNSTDAKQRLREQKIEVRLCRQCRGSLFKSSTIQDSDTAEFIYETHYNLLKQYRKAIDSLLPRYQTLLTNLIAEDPNYSNALAEARRSRKRIVDSFSQFEILATRIASLPAISDSQVRLHRTISKEAMTYLHTRIVSLQTTSEFTKKQRSDSAGVTVQNQVDQATLRDEITMFSEQHYVLSRQADDAKKRRRFDDLASLQSSIQDVVRELASREAQLILWSSET